MATATHYRTPLGQPAPSDHRPTSELCTVTHQDPATRPPADAVDAPGRRRLFLRDLEDRSQAFAHIGPNWFAAVMGTGIVANAAALLPRLHDALHGPAVAIWCAAALLLVVLCAATAVHWVRHRENARAHASNPDMAPFYGAPAMAFMTVGAGSLLVGHDVIGQGAAVPVAFALWGIGTAMGLASSVLVPYWLFTRHEVGVDATFAGWLMPIVPPMVSAATGAALIQHLPAGQAQLTMLLACYAMFGLSLLASLVTITLVWGRMAYAKETPAAKTPTLFIVLGPLGQSITAAGLLGKAAPRATDLPFAAAFRTMGVLYGVPVWGFAMLWLVIAGALVVRAARRGLAFSLTWWSFTFPVGTCVTGTSLLATETGLDAFAWSAVGLFAFLVVAWIVAALRSAHGALVTGTLLQPA